MTGMEPSLDLAAANAASPTGAPARLRIALVAVIAGLALMAGGVAWRFTTPSTPEKPSAPAVVAALTPGTVAAMNSPLFTYGPTWQVSETGADPQEPDDPWTTPSGELSFHYEGRELGLQLAVGDYWGYLYITVDGQPANRLPVIAGNTNSRGESAGYRTFYAPEAQTAEGPAARWVVVHRAATAGPHEVRIEVWRSWGQTPLRGVAVDALPPEPLAARLGAALIAVGGGLLLAAVWAGGLPRQSLLRPAALSRLILFLLRPIGRQPVQIAVALLALLLLAVAVGLRLWWPALGGLALLGYVSLARPSLWAAVLLFSLPFYFSQSLPILPTRATNFIDLGLLGGLVVTAIHRWLLAPPAPPPVLPAAIRRWSAVWGWALAALVVWALAAAAAAEYTALALREWRTVFLAGGLFALLLRGALVDGRPGDRRLLVMAWLAGATVVAAAGLWHFAAGVMVIEAEGVQRIRAFYGSPNNLALYLERTLPVALAFVLLLPSGRDRWLALAAALVQGAALLLTFSKGSLLLGLPVGLATLWLGGWVVLRARGRSRRPLWWIAGAAGAGLLLLLPFLGTERFQRLLDFSQGTGFFRLLLWRSAWQMALDHPLWGVGPDNFLYAFRSQYLLPAAWQEPNLNHPHNWPLDWWTRLGLPGLLLGIAFFGAGCRLLWLRLRSALRGDVTSTALWIGLLASALAALIHGLIDLGYAAPDLMLVWVFTFSLATIPDEPGSRRDEVTETGYSL